jgi:6-phosphogluconolactonase
MRLILGGHEAVALADTATGAVSGRTELVNPSYVAPSPDGRMLYAVCEDPGGPGTVQALRIDGDGLVSHGPAMRTGGDQPCHAAVHPGGRFLLTANYADGSLSALPIRPDGTLGDPCDVARHDGGGPDLPRQAGPHVHQTIVDPSGRWVLACDLGTDEVCVYHLDQHTGALELHFAAGFGPGQGVRHLAFSPDGQDAYVVTELSSELVRCGWDAEGGVLTAGEEISTLATDGTAVDRNYPAAVVVSRDGRRVYVTNRGHDSIAVVDAELFALIGTRSCEGEWPRDAELSRDGRTLFVANENSATVTVFDVTAGVPRQLQDATIDFPAVTSVRVC